MVIKWLKVTHSVTLSNVTLPITCYGIHYENLTIGLHILYLVNMHANFNANKMLFII